jgi:hypothetical protein
MRPVHDEGRTPGRLETRPQAAMSESLQIGINPEQREMILRGLRFVRSSVLLEMRNPTEDEADPRETRLREIEDLVEQLGGARTVEAGV